MGRILDVRGLACPLPVLRAKKALKMLRSGETLEVFSTDPGSVKDFDAFCAATGHGLTTADESDGIYRFVIERKR